MQHLADMLGWVAASLMLATFSCTDPRWLRGVAVCANLSFIAYGIAAELHPIAALHLVLLPINLYRLRGAIRQATLADAARSV